MLKLLKLRLIELALKLRLLEFKLRLGEWVAG